MNATASPGDLSFVHRIKPASEPNRPPVLLLYGTGGNEDDLLPLGRMLSPGSAQLSPRGKVLEGGMPRFFRRLREGVFDEGDVRRRAHEFADFITDAREAYDLAKPVAVGFLNGANIAAAVLQLRPEALAGAAVWRAIVPLQEPPAADLTGKPALILSGATNAIVPAENAKRLAATLQMAGPTVGIACCQRGTGCRRLRWPHQDLDKSALTHSAGQICSEDSSGTAFMLSAAAIRFSRR
jgi:phospholipase/carboxylesterase